MTVAHRAVTVPAAAGPFPPACGAHIQPSESATDLASDLLRSGTGAGDQDLGAAIDAVSLREVVGDLEVRATTRTCCGHEFDLRQGIWKSMVAGPILSFLTQATFTGRDSNPCPEDAVIEDRDFPRI